ncbi:MAG: chorismate mutase [Lachnospiraceae bacterium]|nr:chorismate mutase [Lachnospiraceae bacterium]
MGIEDYRNIIDTIDANIGALLNERLNACREIGKLKKENNIPVADESREKEVIEKVVLAGEDDINKKAICNIYKKIFEETKGLQK